MIKKEILKEIITDFHKSKLPEVKKRVAAVPINTGKIVTLTGVRRCGKTFTLYEVIERLYSKGLTRENVLYINFEDERLELATGELDLILQSYRELYPDLDLGKCYFFFDEMQNVNGWERFTRRIHDTITKNIFITGSNSKLLSRDIATALRGRTITIEIFPLSFREYLIFNDIAIDFYHSQTRSKIVNLFGKFLFDGGFPEVAIAKDTAFKSKILQEYFEVMLYKDLIERFNITNVAVLKYFTKRVFENITSTMSVNKVYNELKSAGYKIGKNTLYDFFDAVESIYLFMSLKKYSESVLKQELAEKKVYAIDNGLLNSITFKYSKDYGKLLENLVFLELIKSGRKVFFYKNKKECDFLTYDKSNTNNTELIQASYSISDQDTKKREIDGLVSACKRFGLDKGHIITFAEEEHIKTEGITIKVVPAFKFFTAKKRF